MSFLKKIRLVLLLVPFCAAAQPEQRISLEPISGYDGIKGEVLDAESGKPLSARIVVKDASGNIQATYYEHLEGIFTEGDGTFSIPLKPGTYRLKAVHGIDYVTQEHSFTIRQNEGKKAVIRLQPWVKLKQKGWINGDGHAHLYSEKQANDTMLRQVRKICLAQGVDFISACQGWAGYNDTTWKEAYAKVSDEKFSLFYGAEMPKYRTSHVWWLGLKSTLNNFGNLIDSTYETQYYQSEKHADWDYSWLKFKSVPDLEVISRFARSQNAMAIIAHPTSWWWQKRGDISKYTTNVVSNLAFGLLSGNSWNGMAVMGYMNDNYFYQNIWFHVLNEGYIMPPFSELDGGYPRDNKFYYGSMRTYFQTDSLQEQPIDRLTEAVRKGHTFVTSGPVIFAEIDKKYKPGDILETGKNPRSLHIEAYASGEAEDFLSYIIVFRNGKIHHVWDLRKQKPRQFKSQLPLQENEKSWYAVKVYGSKAWADPQNLDVLAYCQSAERAAQRTDFPGGKHSVAFTSPFYFRSENRKQPEPLISEINLSVISPKTSKPVENCKVDVFIAGEKINSFELKNGRAQVHIPIHALLKIHADGYAPITRCLYTDYEPYLKINEKIANGKWLEEHNWKTTLNKSHVPWSVFQFEKTKAVLSEVKWEIRLEPNEREGLWEKFDALFAE